MRFNGKRVVALALAGAITLQATGCGTIFYPERRGQSGGKIDPAVAIMDGLGLLLFLVPGVVAFAVDFSTGAIYLPGTARRSDLGESDGVKQFTLEGDITPERLQALIAAETGQNVDLSDAEVRNAEGAEPDMLVRLLNSDVQAKPVFN